MGEKDFLKDCQELQGGIGPPQVLSQLSSVCVLLCVSLSLPSVCLCLCVHAFLSLIKTFLL